MPYFFDDVNLETVALVSERRHRAAIKSMVTQLSELRKLRNPKFEYRNPKQIRIF